MNVSHRWLMGAVLAACSVSQAQQVQPQVTDFAMQLPLTVSGANGVVQLRLPVEAYQHSSSPNLGDLRVFNAAGEPLPFAVLPGAISSERVRWRESTAQLFPIYGGSTANAAQTRLSVRVAANGALVSVHTADSSAGTRPLTALILDAGPQGSNELLDSLQLVRADATTYRAELAIERSDDLQLWDRIAQSRVDWLQGTQAESLVNDRIAIGTRGGRYLRLQWLDGAPQVFERVIVRWRSTESIEAQPLEVKLQPTSGAIAGDLRYTASPSIEATQIGLELPTVNAVLPMSIGYYQPPGREPRRELQERFVPVAQGTFYRLIQDGKERTSSTIRIAPWSTREWVVRRSDMGDIRPVLVLRWYPSTLVFTARSAGNDDAERRRFILAVGASPKQTQRWLNQRTSVDRVAPGFDAAELAAVERAVAGEWQRGGAAIPARPVAVMSWMPQRSLILWAVLIVGALVLGVMTWRLYRQMQAAPPS